MSKTEENFLHKGRLIPLRLFCRDKYGPYLEKNKEEFEYLIKKGI